jgi:hypothetical protein
VEVTQTHVARFRVGEETAAASIPSMSTPHRESEQMDIPVETSVG